MRILLTGGSGFLGKRVLELLLADERIEHVDVLSRSKKSHPDPKVRILSLDLSHAESLHAIQPDLSAVIHLAGLYDFKRDASSNYSNNVLAATNLVEYLRSLSGEYRAPILMASSYVVGLGSDDDQAEALTTVLPKTEAAYAYTKALAEKIVTGSEIPSTVFRLGVLVGDSANGKIEKIEGPYYLMAALARLSRVKLPKLLRGLGEIPIPLPGNPEQVIPLVPVDFAAKAFHEALFRKETFDAGVKIYGVYREDSVTLRKLCTALVESIAPGYRAVFIGSLSGRLARGQELLSGIPPEALRMVSEKIALGSRAFERDFPAVKLPAFEEYSTAFIQGFLKGDAS